MAKKDVVCEVRTSLFSPLYYGDHGTDTRESAESAVTTLLVQLASTRQGLTALIRLFNVSPYVRERGSLIVLPDGDFDFLPFVPQLEAEK